MFSGSARFRCAYLATDYVVRYGPHDVVIRIDHKSQAVDRLLSRFNARTGVFITAWNPLSKARGLAANTAAHRRLVGVLRSAAKPFLEGDGRGTDGDWPPEQSLLAFGLDRRAAASLGRRFRQNAVVFTERKRPAELLMLR